MPNSHGTLIETIRLALARLGQGRNTLHSHHLIERLQEKTGLTIIEVRRGLSELRAAGEIDCRDWVNGEPFGKVRLKLSAPPLSAVATAWHAALVSRELSTDEIAALLPVHGVLVKFEAGDMGRLVDGLVRLRAEQDRCAGLPRFNVSAEFLLGSSKLLDTLPTAALRSFGIDKTRFERFSGYLVVAGPPNPVACVLVENPHAFETAMAAPGTEDVAWIVTFGHGLSVHDEDYGAQLTEMLASRPRLPNALVRKGNPPDISSLLQHEALFFWGDLDLEGLRIFERLKSKLGRLRLSALYQPMVDALGDDVTSHPYLLATGKEGQTPWTSTDTLISSLIARCAERGVDQEAIDTKTIERLCRFPIARNH